MNYFRFKQLMERNTNIKVDRDDQYCYVASGNNYYLKNGKKMDVKKESSVKIPMFEAGTPIISDVGGFTESEVHIMVVFSFTPVNEKDVNKSKLIAALNRCFQMAIEAGFASCNSGSEYDSNSPEADALTWKAMNSVDDYISNNLYSKEK